MQSVSRQEHGNGILSCSGLLSGVFGTGEACHVACWETGKIVDRFEETDDQAVTTIREREQFTQRMTLVFADGRTSMLCSCVRRCCNSGDAWVSPMAPSTPSEGRWDGVKTFLRVFVRRSGDNKFLVPVTASWPDSQTGSEEHQRK
jgi:hypothetical protein